MKGFCECGCGQKTKPARQTDHVKGWIRGEALRFINGHHQRLLASREVVFAEEYEVTAQTLRTGKESTMKPFELPPSDTIRAVITLNAFQFHEVLPGSFRLDDTGRVEWRDKNQPGDLYVTRIDRIAYVVARVPVAKKVGETT